MDGHRARWLLLCVVFAFALSSHAQTPSSDRETAGLAAEQAGRLREAFDDYVAAWQALPDPPPADAYRRLRERIIKLALKLDPPPAVPEEAQQRLASAQALSKSLQKPEDVQAAGSEFQRALRLAPWWASGYFTVGESLEKLGSYPAAAQSFELYLLAAPAAQDAESVRKRIHDLRARFPAMYQFAHHFGSGGDFVTGDLIVSNGSIRFGDSFTFPVSDVRSVEKGRGPMFLRSFPALHIQLKNGKKFVLLPIGLGDEAADAIEKAIKDMDPEHRIVFK
jgi:tetratricopeptide (TPR) repeat protein